MRWVGSWTKDPTECLAFFRLDSNRRDRKTLGIGWIPDPHGAQDPDRTENG